MNTGSEFNAIRQLVFAGDRIVVVYEAGNAPYQGKEPMSRYRVVSLDRATGAVKKQMELIRRWGSMPVLLATSDGHVVLASSQLQLLNPDLEPVGAPFPVSRDGVDTISPDGTTLASKKLSGTTLLNASDFKPILTMSEVVPTSISSNAMLNDIHNWSKEYPNDRAFITRTDAKGSKLIIHSRCGGLAQFLASDRILSSGCDGIRILNNEGEVVATGRTFDVAIHSRASTKAVYGLLCKPAMGGAIPPHSFMSASTFMKQSPQCHWRQSLSVIYRNVSHGVHFPRMVDTLLLGIRIG